MPDKVNKLRNPDFTAGGKEPLGWRFLSTPSGASWSRTDRERGLCITAPADDSTALLRQIVVCKPGQHYRVEIDGTCEVTPCEQARNVQPAGLVIILEPMSMGERPRPVGERRVTPGLHRATRPVTVRAFWQAPKECRRVRASVGIQSARGTANIQCARLIPVLETDQMSHPLATPPPPHAVRSPRMAAGVCVCSATADDRRLTAWLAGFFGRTKTKALHPDRFDPARHRSDALFLPDGRPPRAVRSLAALFRLAEDRIVVISLPAFETLARGSLRLRRVEQADDPIHGQVHYGNHATHGFALHDVFPYSWPGRVAGSFVQNQFRRSDAAERFLQQHGLRILLRSQCDQDVTSERPIALWKSTAGGGLFVLDIEPVEADGTTCGEPALAGHLLLNILGRRQAGLGRYCSPVAHQRDMRDLIREMPMRLDNFVVHDDDVPSDAVTEQVVTIGRPDETFGLRLAPRPVILVRSGLVSGDAESFYGPMLWFKEFARTASYPCPYATALSSRFRFIWIPHAADWEPRTGWLRRRTTPETCSAPLKAQPALSEVLGGADVAALIDVVSQPIHRVRVIVPNESGAYRDYGAHLTQLARQFPLGRYYVPTVREGDGYGDRDAVAWRRVDYVPHVVADALAFERPIHRDVMRSGGRVIRLEAPGHDADFTCQSILRTELVATLLEHVIGLQYGLIAVNRTPVRVCFDSLPPIDPGDALILDRDELACFSGASRVG